MQFLDLNLSEVTTDTINNLSDISFSADTPYPEQNGGGFFSFLSGSTKVEKAALEAAKEKNLAVVEFMIDKELISSFNVQDKDGYTILHYLISVPNPNLKLIGKLTKRSDAKKFINKQNKDGDTPLILAVKSGHHDLCTLLINAGADKTIKNKNGLHVDTETEDNLNKNNNDNDVMVGTFKQSPLFEFSASPKEVGEILEPIKRLFNKRKEQMQFTSEPAPIQLTDTQQMTSSATEEFIQKIKKQINGNDSYGQLNKLPSDTDETIKRLNSFIADKHQAGGSCGCDGSHNTENLISAIENHFNSHTGGAKKNKSKKSGKSNGVRKIKSYVDSGLESEDRGTELSRVINNQTSEIIDRAIKTIQTILTENKKDFKGIKTDEETARAIKSIIWKSLREKNPDMKSALDIAVEMEKLVTKDYIKQIDAKQVKDMIDVLDKHAIEKKQQQKNSDTVSSTSSSTVPSESNLSATSI